MSAFVIRPAVREGTPLIVGLAGPSKGGKTMSALRLAVGLALGRKIVMINAEGARGHQYADKFKYDALDISAPYSYTRYDEALQVAAASKPGCVIVDSISHAHDGPGGMIEEHDADVERRAGDDYKKRERVTFAAWIKPKAAENKFIYRMLSMDCPIILCFRAKEKIKIVPGKDPVDLGYQPIASERISFETIFSLMLPPRSKGVPDLALSDLREPFDDMIPRGQPITEKLGEELAQWAAGNPVIVASTGTGATVEASADGYSEPPADYITPDQVANLETACQDAGVSVAALRETAQVSRLSLMEAADYAAALGWIERRKKRTA